VSYLLLKLCCIYCDFLSSALHTELKLLLIQYRICVCSICLFLKSNLPLVSSQLETSFNIFLHGLINYIATEAKCRHLKKLTCKGTLWQVFIRVHRLEIQSVMLVFSTQLCDARGNLGVKKIVAPSKYPLKWPMKYFAIKIISRIFKMSGTLIVKICN
jgi:hypothetical protein